MKIAIVSDLTLDPVVSALKGEFTDSEIEFSYADNVLLFLHSNLQKLKESDFLIVHSDVWFSGSAEQVSACTDFLATAFADWKGTILLPDQVLPFGINAMQGDLGIGHGIYSEKTIKNIADSRNIIFYRWQDKIAEIGTKNAYHFGLGHLYQMPYTKPAQTSLAACWASYLRFLSTEEKKCILVDLDNTLWGGILGEDGPDGIRVDKNAAGMVYLHFQEFLKQKKAEGFLLCICSKNNEEEVVALFEQKNMPLSLQDFIVRKINWKDKYLNLREISAELNIGLSSFIFIDDSDFETGSVKELIPEITVFQFSKDYRKFREMAGDLVFRKRRILDTDKKKTEAYEAEKQRNSVAESAGGMEEFIRSLQLRADFSWNDTNSLERLSQLTGKTNQFNFNKEALSENELQEFIQAGNFILSGKLEDKFGDYGIIGLMLLEKGPDNKARLRNFLMSCRALGRGVEEMFVNELHNHLQLQGLTLGNIEFKKTEKNTPAAVFLPEINSKFGLK